MTFPPASRLAESVRMVHQSHPFPSKILKLKDFKHEKDDFHAFFRYCMSLFSKEQAGLISPSVSIDIDLFARAGATIRGRTSPSSSPSDVHDVFSSILSRDIEPMLLALLHISRLYTNFNFSIRVVNDGKRSGTKTREPSILRLIENDIPSLVERFLGTFRGAHVRPVQDSNYLLSFVQARADADFATNTDIFITSDADGIARARFVIFHLYFTTAGTKVEWIDCAAGLDDLLPNKDEDFMLWKAVLFLCRIIRSDHGSVVGSGAIGGRMLLEDRDVWLWARDFF